MLILSQTVPMFTSTWLLEDVTRPTKYRAVACGGVYAAAAGEDSKVRIWEITKNGSKLRSTIESHEMCSIAMNSSCLAIGSTTGEISLHSLPDAKVIRRVNTPFRNAGSGLRLQSCGKYLIAFEDCQTVLIDSDGRVEKPFFVTFEASSKAKVAIKAAKLHSNGVKKSFQAFALQGDAVVIATATWEYAMPDVLEWTVSRVETTQHSELRKLYDVDNRGRVLLSGAHEEMKVFDSGSGLWPIDDELPELVKSVDEFPKLSDMRMIELSGRTVIAVLLQEYKYMEIIDLDTGRPIAEWRCSGNFDVETPLFRLSASGPETFILTWRDQSDEAEGIIWFGNAKALGLSKHLPDPIQDDPRDKEARNFYRAGHTHVTWPFPEAYEIGYSSDSG